MPLAVSLALVTIVAVMAVMAGEAALSAYHAGVLRARGAVEPAGDPYQALQIVYPGSFLLMGVEGALTGPAPMAAIGVGLGVFGLAKALKGWAIASLGVRWSFRVLVLPGAPLVTRGPYRLLRHPNYVAIYGEIVGVALTVHAPVSGLAALAAMSWLLRRRIEVENRALGRTA